MIRSRATCTFLAASLWFSFALTNARANNNATPQQVFDGMRESFHPEKARNVNVRYQFELSGGPWWIEVKNQKCKVARGRIDHPDVTFIATDTDWVALSDGKLNGFWAYVTGRLKVHGDQNLARKLDQMFN